MDKCQCQMNEVWQFECRFQNNKKNERKKTIIPV